MSNCSSNRAYLGLQEHNKHNHNNNSRVRQQQSRRQPTHFASCDCVMEWADEEWKRRRGGVELLELGNSAPAFNRSPIHPFLVKSALPRFRCALLFLLLLCNYSISCGTAAAALVTCCMLLLLVHATKRN